MHNNYSNRQRQIQGAENDKGNGSARATIKQGEAQVKEMAGEAQQQLKEGGERAGEIIGAVDKQVRENPWPVIAGVAVVSFLLGALFNKSDK